MLKLRFRQHPCPLVSVKQKKKSSMATSGHDGSNEIFHFKVKCFRSLKIYMYMYEREYIDSRRG